MTEVQGCALIPGHKFQVSDPGSRFGAGSGFRV